MNNTEQPFPTRITELVTEIAKAHGVGLDRARQIIAHGLGLKKDSPRQIYNWERGLATPHNAAGIIRQIESILINAKSGATMDKPQQENNSTILDIISKLDAKIIALEKEIKELKSMPTIQHEARKVYLLKEVTIREADEHVR